MIEICLTNHHEIYLDSLSQIDFKTRFLAQFDVRLNVG